MTKAGFTLIEVIIVIVILGVLATLALPRITGNLETANAAEAMQFFGAIRRAVMDCVDMSGGDTVACNTAAKLGMTIPPGTKFDYFSGAGVGAMEFDAIRNSGPKAGQRICMYIDTDTGRATFDTPFQAGFFNGVVARTGNQGDMNGWICSMGFASTAL